MTKIFKTTFNWQKMINFQREQNWLKIYKLPCHQLNRIYILFLWDSINTLPEWKPVVALLRCNRDFKQTRFFLRYGDIFQEMEHERKKERKKERSISSLICVSKRNDIFNESSKFFLSDLIYILKVFFRLSSKQLFCSFTLKGIFLTLLWSNF